MRITLDTHVSDVASSLPSTIKVFQQYGIDFCCGGRLPLSEACDEHHVDASRLLADLQASVAGLPDTRDWRQEPLTDLITYIQTRYHEPLREELPRLEAMLDKVISRHGDRYGDMLLPLRGEFDALSDELLSHMTKEDRMLFPAIAAVEQGTADAATKAWLSGPVAVMEREHESAGAALRAMRDITGGYTPPAGACPTFQGLFFGLHQLELDMHVHIHLENNILFPGALARL